MGRVGICEYCGGNMESVWDKSCMEYHWRCENLECQERERKRREEVRRKANESRLARIRSNPERYLQEFKVPMKYLSCSLSNFENGGKVAAYCREYAKDLVQGCAGNVLFTGGCGSGKTHLAVAILREAKCEGFTGEAIFTTAPELLLNIREAFSDKSEITEREVINKFSNVDLLVLDDLGAEKQSIWAITTLFLIIDRRLRELRPTVVTSNLNLEGIAEVLEERIASRLSESKVIKLKLPDYRKRRVVQR